jgi:hypothetical protein
MKKPLRVIGIEAFSIDADGKAVPVTRSDPGKPPLTLDAASIVRSTDWLEEPMSAARLCYDVQYLKWCTLTWGVRVVGEARIDYLGDVLKGKKPKPKRKDQIDAYAVDLDMDPRTVRTIMGRSRKIIPKRR